MSLTPPTDAVTYETDSGLTLWMDYVNGSRPYTAPTIRTSDPSLRVVFVPSRLQYYTTYLMQFDERQIAFGRPFDQNRLHNADVETLQARNPGLDLVISSIGHGVVWTYSVADSQMQTTRDVDVPLDVAKTFRTREEQQQITTLFCELMAWAVDGQIEMARGYCVGTQRSVTRKIVGFDHALQTRLASGQLIGA